MKPYFEQAGVTLYHGDCLDVSLDSLVDAVVTDPPYELSFMGKKWDGTGIAFQPETWTHIMAQMKPGAHLLAFGGSRTFHRMAVAIEDAGFEIRDTLMWVYGSGFPKSLDVSKAIDKAAGAEREYLGPKIYADGTVGHASNAEHDGWQRPWKNDPEAVKRNKGVTAPATPEAERWSGWGTALKPSYEPILLCRKPLAEKTVAANVLAHGVGGLNIDATRIESGSRPLINSTPKNGNYRGIFREGSHHGGETTQGRWPANVLLDEAAAALLDEQSGERKSGGRAHKAGDAVGGEWRSHENRQDIHRWGSDYEREPDKGGASRFFYVAKASRKERGEGNGHPTVKPLKLCQWLVRLICPPNGVVLDPFMGSGSIGCAARLEGFQFVGIEQDESYCEIAERRLSQSVLPLEVSA